MDAGARDVKEGSEFVEEFHSVAIGVVFSTSIFEKGEVAGYEVLSIFSSYIPAQLSRTWNLPE